jgi:hypothetical protein
MPPRHHAPPSRRRLKIFAFDPMLGRSSKNRITVDVPFEELLPGPVSDRLQIIDYDTANDRYYPPLDLNDVNVALADGVEPSESDPRFHQQMVYAVARRVLENFDTALGRVIRFRRGRRLRIFPHALSIANAFYDPKLTALLFGYFRTSSENTTVGLPRQLVFSCLSHDIIAHEMTHALVDRLRPLFIEPTNVDVAAFHEGFSDIVAILQHFSFPTVLREFCQTTRSDLRDAGPMVELAREFGYATGGGEALRTAIGKPDPALYRTEFEPHDRGALLVAAVFGTFFEIYQSRIKDLMRIATGGTGELPPGDIHPDLANRVAGEAARTAQSLLLMCIRAFEYLPPIDVTFGDFLRALVTADAELNPHDESVRATLVENFRMRGIYPRNVTSLALESMMLDGEGLPALQLGNLQQELYQMIGETSRNRQALKVTRERMVEEEEPLSDRDEDSRDLHDEFIALVKSYVTDPHNAPLLGLAPDYKTAVRGFHPSVRIGGDGQLLVELVAQVVQKVPDPPADLGGVALRAGVTLVFASDGRVRHVIRKPLPFPGLAVELQHHAKERRRRIEEFVAACDARDAALPWADETFRRTRIAARMNFAALHGSRSL